MCDSWVSGLAELEASMSWRSGQAYSQDLRERILAAIDAGMSVREAARLFRVSISYIYKAMIRRRRTGETSARSQHGHVGQKLAPYHEAIRNRVSAQPDATLDELPDAFDRPRPAEAGAASAAGVACAEMATKPPLSVRL
jgi:transposase